MVYFPPIISLELKSIIAYKYKNKYKVVARSRVFINHVVLNVDNRTDSIFRDVYFNPYSVLTKFEIKIRGGG